MLIRYFESCFCVKCIVTLVWIHIYRSLKCRNMSIHVINMHAVCYFRKESDIKPQYHNWRSLTSWIFFICFFLACCPPTLLFLMNLQWAVKVNTDKKRNKKAPIFLPSFMSRCLYVHLPNLYESSFRSVRSLDFLPLQTNLLLHKTPETEQSSHLMFSYFSKSVSELRLL